MRANTRPNHLRVIRETTVEQRLRAAFPEVDLEKIASRSPTLNAHNLGEKWDATVRQVQWWIDISQQ